MHDGRLLITLHDTDKNNSTSLTRSDVCQPTRPPATPVSSSSSKLLEPPPSTRLFYTLVRTVRLVALGAYINIILAVSSPLDENEELRMHAWSLD
jgi:hypothetical protein